jgi:hypothetical protein
LVNLPDWLKESLNRRFIDLSYTAERQDKVVPIKSRAKDIFEYLRNNQDELGSRIFLEWEDLKNHHNTIEKEWLYFEGVMDGIKLMHDIYLCLEK